MGRNLESKVGRDENLMWKDKYGAGERKKRTEENIL